MKEVGTGYWENCHFGADNSSGLGTYSAVPTYNPPAGAPEPLNPCFLTSSPARDTLNS